MRTVGIIVTLVLLSSINVSAASNDLPVEKIAFGFEIEWSYMEEIAEETAGLEIESIITMIEEAAIEEGDMTLSITLVNEGQTYLYNVISEDDETVEIEDANGNTHDVTKKITEMNMRHYSIQGFNIQTEWSDNRAGIDLELNLKLEQTMIVDIKFTEYLNEDNEFLGLDVESEGSFQFDNSLEIDGILEGKSSNKTIVFENTALEVDVGWSWEELVFEWRMGAPGDFYNGMYELANDDDLDFLEYECDDNNIPTYSYNGTIYVEDDCGEAEVDYTYGFNYNVHLQNFPNAVFGLPDYWNDVQITDDYDCGYGDSCDDSEGVGDEYLENIGYETRAEKLGTEIDDFLTGSNREFMETGPVIVPNTMVFPIIAGAYLYGASAMAESLGPTMQSEGEQAAEQSQDNETGGDSSTIEGVMEDIMESALPRDMGRIRDGVVDELDEHDDANATLIEPQPPFYGGDARLVWDVSSGHGICWQVDVQTEENGPMMSMFGPNMDNLDEHEIVGFSYYFGAEAAATQEDVAEMENSQDIYISESDTTDKPSGPLEGIPFPNILLVVLAIVCVATIVRRTDD